ncbi:hypothetical protein HC928_01315 [bacterium]|nr:hypothetical protein [bacterium]
MSYAYHVRSDALVLAETIGQTKERELLKSGYDLQAGMFVRVHQPGIIEGDEMFYIDFVTLINGKARIGTGKGRTMRAALKSYYRELRVRHKAAQRLPRPINRWDVKRFIARSWSNDIPAWAECPYEDEDPASDAWYAARNRNDRIEALLMNY